MSSRYYDAEMKEEKNQDTDQLAIEAEWQKDLPRTEAEFQELLFEYFAGTLDAVTHRAVDEHLDVCEACRGRAEGLRRVIEHMRRLGPSEQSSQSNGCHTSHAKMEYIHFSH